jgi:hypothetical protein
VGEVTVAVIGANPLQLALNAGEAPGLAPPEDERVVVKYGILLILCFHNVRGLVSFALQALALA